LNRFHEIWAPSAFIADSIREVCARPLFVMPIACEARLTSFLNRSAFGIPESAYVFFFYFDFTSFIDRKNPFGALEAFRRLGEAAPSADVALVLKTNVDRATPADLSRFREAIAAAPGRVIVIDQQLTDNETKNLVRCSDCFLSLHRSEGFGRGMSEAMFLGKPVIATGYSGNLEFMTEETGYLLDYGLVPVQAGQYPFGEGQVWADPDIDQAVRIMRRLVEHPVEGYARGEAAGRRIRQHFSYRATGLRYRARLEALRDRIVRDSGSAMGTVASGQNLRFSPAKINLEEA
jgi:glycosyltransferase involved in cell wall biosynthesis